MNIQKAMVFGVFDGLHPGHQYFLTDAQKRCEQLIVVLTQSEMVLSMKGFSPHHSYTDREQAIKNFNPQVIVVPSDEILGSWQVLKTHQPDMVFLGHDQHGIAKELEKISIPFTYLDAHHPEKYKSSLLLKRT